MSVKITNSKISQLLSSYFKISIKLHHMEYICMSVHSCVKEQSKELSKVLSPHGMPKHGPGLTVHVLIKKSDIRYSYFWHSNTPDRMSRKLTGQNNAWYEAKLGHLTVTWVGDTDVASLQLYQYAALVTVSHYVAHGTPPSYHWNCQCTTAYG